MKMTSPPRYEATWKMVFPTRPSSDLIINLFLCFEEFSLVILNGPGSLESVAVLKYHNKYSTNFVTKNQKEKSINATVFLPQTIGISQRLRRLPIFLLIGEEYVVVF
ncbi:hypothetical protein EV1_034877 [Malus domestica]